MITDEDVDDFLAHYGKVGMHWGKRSSGSSSSKKSSKGKAAVNVSLNKHANEKSSGMKHSALKIGTARVAFILGIIGARIALNVYAYDHLYDPGSSTLDPSQNKYPMT